MNDGSIMCSSIGGHLSFIYDEVAGLLIQEKHSNPIQNINVYPNSDWQVPEFPVWPGTSEFIMYKVALLCQSCKLHMT